MSRKLAQLVASMTPQKQEEIEIFAAFLLPRRQLQEPRLVTVEISVEEFMALVTSKTDRRRPARSDAKRHLRPTGTVAGGLRSPAPAARPPAAWFR